MTATKHECEDSAVWDKVWLASHESDECGIEICGDQTCGFGSRVISSVRKTVAKKTKRLAKESVEFLHEEGTRRKRIAFKRKARADFCALVRVGCDMS